MSDHCRACQKPLGFLDGAYAILESLPDYVLCNDCYRKYASLKYTTGEQFATTFGHFRELLEDPQTPSAIKKQLNALQVKQAEVVQKQMQKENEEKRISNMLLTTGSNFEGYRITAYLDVICEEVFFKNSLGDCVSADVGDFGRLLSFAEAEMEGMGELVARARMHAKEKFCRKAVSLGANGVLGIDFESSVGIGNCHVTIFGTAVVLEKNV